ncbi:MAG: gamma-glutamyltranspeptidase/glutathione hydrolase [Candidatus Paceibacteria bacterium]
MLERLKGRLVDEPSSGNAPWFSLCLLLAFGCRSNPPETFPDKRVQAGAVVSEHPLATAAGLGVLERGGNAADAAVATALALAVVYPQAGNLGGGGFALVSEAGEDPRALDFRERAPLTADPAQYLDVHGVAVGERSLRGPLAVGVPGTPMGLYTLYEEHGSKSLSWAQLVAPAIALAREGFEVDPWLARDLLEMGSGAKLNKEAEDLFFPDQRPLQEGDRLVQADLAQTLTRLAQQGPTGFYGGHVAAAMLETLSHEPVPGVGMSSQGVMTQRDLDEYKIVWRAPLVGAFQGHECFAMPSPSSGGLVILQSLAILEGMPLEREVANGRADGSRGNLGAKLAHWWIEALRRSFADRAEHMGDPDFHEVPVAELLSPEWILERRISIGEQADLSVGAWTPPPPGESNETTHLSVVDSMGGAVSLTTTLNGSFGSGIMVRGAGFLLNNELDDFAIQAGVPNQFGLIGSRANAIMGGKRPLSSMSPMIVRDQRGQLKMVLGSPGGPRIISAVMQVLMRVLLLEEDLHLAVRSPRLHQQWRPEQTIVEGQQGGGFDPSLLKALRERGHPLEVLDRKFGSVQAILIDGEGWPVATSDPRRGGAAGVEGLGVQAPALPKR